MKAGAANLMGFMTMQTRPLAVLALVSALALTLAACSDTWSGLKKDTTENMETTGNAISKVGNDIVDEEEDKK